MRASFSGASILLVEDDTSIGSVLSSSLQAHGLRVRWCRTGASGLSEAQQAPPEVALLDLGLPDADGIDIARTLRSRLPHLVLILLTARDGDIDIIAGLDAGADDYLTKPFSTTVLLARIRAQLRHAPPPPALAPQPLQIGALTLDLAGRRCLLGRREVELRPKEFDLLAYLAGRPDHAITRDELMTQIWDTNWHGSTKTLDVTLASLRQRLGAAAAHTTSTAPLPVITTLRGHGYRLELTPILSTSTPSTALPLQR